MGCGDKQWGVVQEEGTWQLDQFEKLTFLKTDLDVLNKLVCLTVYDPLVITLTMVFCNAEMTKKATFEGC